MFGIDLLSCNVKLLQMTKNIDVKKGPGGANIDLKKCPAGGAEINSSQMLALCFWQNWSLSSWGLLGVVNVWLHFGI